MKGPHQWRFFFLNIYIFIFLDTLILKIYFLIIKINNFRGDLSDIFRLKRQHWSSPLHRVARVGVHHVWRMCVASFITPRHAKHACAQLADPVVIFWPNSLIYRSTHPENYIFSLSKKTFSGSKYPTNSLFNFEKRSTAQTLLCIWAGVRSSDLSQEPQPIFDTWCTGSHQIPCRKCLIRPQTLQSSSAWYLSSAYRRALISRTVSSPKRLLGYKESGLSKQFWSWRAGVCHRKSVQIITKLRYRCLTDQISHVLTSATQFKHISSFVFKSFKPTSLETGNEKPLACPFTTLQNRW